MSAGAAWVSFSPRSSVGGLPGRGGLRPGGVHANLCHGQALVNRR